MKIIENKSFDEERAFYASENLKIVNCSFEGEADGESAFKECRGITVESCLWRLRYPFWHDDGLAVRDTELTESCRAAFWYSRNIDISNSRLHGIKAMRECENVKITDCNIKSTEFGWSVNNIQMSDTSVEGEYFMLRSTGLHFKNVELRGKYSFQYIENAIFEDCVLNTKDAFWHAKNVIVRNSIVNGEYLGWYSENVTFEGCHITGTQPLCYCKGLRLIDCEMHDADLSFEKSEVEATLTAPIVSIKNPYSGHIQVPSADEIILDDERARCEIITKK